MYYYIDMECRILFLNIILIVWKGYLNYIEIYNYKVYCEVINVILNL